MDDLTLFEPEKLIADFNGGTGYFENVLHKISKYPKNYVIAIDKFMLYLREKNDLKSFTVLAHTYDHTRSSFHLWYMTDILNGIMKHHDEAPNLFVMLCEYFNGIPFRYFLKYNGLLSTDAIKGIKILSKTQDMKNYLNLCDLHYAFCFNAAELLELILSYGYKKEHGDPCSCNRTHDYGVPKESFNVAMKMNMKFDTMSVTHYYKFYKYVELVNYVIHNGLDLTKNLSLISNSIENGQENIINFIINNIEDKCVKSSLLQYVLKQLIIYPRENYTMNFLKNDQIAKHVNGDIIDTVYCRYNWDRDYRSKIVIEFTELLNPPQNVLNHFLVISSYNSGLCDFTEIVKLLITKKVDVTYKSYKAFRTFLMRKQTNICEMIIKSYPFILNDIDYIAYKYIGTSCDRYTYNSNMLHETNNIINFLISFGASPNLERRILSTLRKMNSAKERGNDQYYVELYTKVVRYLIKVSFMFNNPCSRDLCGNQFYKTWDNNKKGYVSTKCIRSPIKP